MRALRSPVRVSDAPVDDETHPPHRRSLGRDEVAGWITAGGYIAAGDGLSEAESRALAASAVHPELDARACTELLREGASLDVLPPTLIQVLRRSGPFVRLQLIANIQQAVASDGMSGPEWVRFCEVATAVLGADKVTEVLRYCFAHGDALKHQAGVLGLAPGSA